MIILAILLVLGAGLWSVSRSGFSVPAVVEPVRPTMGTAMVPIRPKPLTARPQIISNTVARVVAAVGAYDDGRRETLDDLTSEERALIDLVRPWLAATTSRPAPGLPMMMPDGTVAGMAPDPTPRRTANAVTVDVTDPASPVGREHARAIDGRLVARTLSSGDKAPTPTRGDRVKEILEPDAWIAVPYDPARVAGEPLEITNRSLGHYVLRLDADDYGSVRLNGGLVVPGRYYLMDGTMTISGDVPVGVTIRPLGVVHGYFDQPVRPPSANG